MEAQRRFEMIAVVAAHRADDAQVIGTVGHVREQIADHQPALAARAELPQRALDELAGPALLSSLGKELRLVIKRIDVRDPAAHVQENDALRPGREMRRMRREGVVRRAAPLLGRQQLANDRRHQQRPAQQRTDHLTS